MDLEYIPFNDKDSDDNTSSANKSTLLTDNTAPWLGKEGKDKIKCSPLVKLHNEILDFCDFISLTNEELLTRDLLLKEITSIIKNLWPDSKVSIFGSQMTRILTPSSDLDIAVLNVPIKPHEDVRDMLQILADKIRDIPNFVSYIETILSAKVPIVKFDHKDSGISVDICLNNDDGLKTGKIVRKLVRDFPPLRPLTLVLKTYLNQRRFNDTYTGGIGSFVLCSMVASQLQMKQAAARFLQIVPTWNLGVLLLEFFQLYGIQFNYFTVGISIADSGKYFPKRKQLGMEQNSGRPNLLTIQNPQFPDQDMGKNSFLMPKIKRCFEHTHQLLTAALSDSTLTSYLSFVIRADDPLLKRRSQVDPNKLHLKITDIENFDSVTSNEINSQITSSNKDFNGEDREGKKKRKRKNKTLH